MPVQADSDNSGRAWQAAELAARTSYGRLLALLAARSGDIAAAEDALAEAFVAALRRWPLTGVPECPDAWLLTSARNLTHKTHRHANVRLSAVAELERIAEERAQTRQAFPDARLMLLFVCAHPAIDASIRAPLMLQTVLGLDASAVASAYLCAPAAMSQRLVRAKTKIRDARLRFSEPLAHEIESRLPDILEAIYGAYGLGWDDVGGASGTDLSREAIFLGQLVEGLVPQSPEAKGLLALMLYCEARRPARRGPDDAFIPLAQQDPRLWSRPRIVEAEKLLIAASRFQQFGRFQCEAAIQSLHIQRPMTGGLNYPALLLLHDLLAERAPSMGALVSRAALRIELGQAAVALEELDRLPVGRLDAYQPYWVVRHRALKALGSPHAESALQRALALTADEGVRDFLLRGTNQDPKDADDTVAAAGR